MTITECKTFQMLGNLPDFVISGLTYDDSVVVRISAGFTGTYSDVFNETLTVGISGKITIMDMPGLLEDYAKDTSLMMVNFSVKCGDETASTTWYVKSGNAECEDFTDYITSHFLTDYSRKRTCEGRKEMLRFFIVDTGETKTVPTATCRAYYMDGTYEDFDVTPVVDEEYSKTQKDWEEDDDYHYINMYTIDSSPSQFVSSGKTLLRYVIDCNGRSMEYYLDPEHDDPAAVFLYRNSFNEWDMLYCNGKLEYEDSYEREGTTVNGVYKNYKVKETKYRNVDTGILMNEEKEWVLGILRSTSTYLCKYSAGEYSKWKEVAITDNEAKYSDEPDALDRYTFTCRLAQKRQNIIDTSSYPQIFTEIFSEQYE